MIICDSSNIDIIQGVIGYGNATEGITDWRITNTSSGIFNILNSSSIIIPSGGISEIGEIAGTIDRYIIFKQGTSTFYVPPSGIICDLLVVGGGGGGGGSGIYENGGGGGGGIVYMVKKTFVSGTYNVIVGNGGVAGAVGGDSSINLNDTPISFDSISIVGKGGGGAGDPGGNGGSGGGGNYQIDYIYDDNDNIIYFNNYGTATQGNTFWDGTTYVPGGFNGKSGSRNSGGGGGGAAEAGETDFYFKGGDGRAVSITGTSVFYGGGGGGGAAIGSQGGNGGGGSGGTYGNGIPGTPNTGGGGGGADRYYYGGAGGSGIVIIRYSTIPNISIIENGNVGIGTSPVISSSKTEIIGDINISGIYKKNNSDVFRDTSNYVLSTSNVLTNYYISNKPTGGNGINISETLPSVISSTQWTTLGDNIYNTSLGAVSINTTVISSSELIISENSAAPGFTYMPFKICAGAYSDTGNGTATLIELGTQYSSYSKCAIGHCRTNTFDRGAIVFLCNNIVDTSTVEMVNEVMRIDMNRNVGINTTNSAFKLEIGTGIGEMTSRSRTYMNASYNYLRTATGSWGGIGFIANSAVWATTSFNTGCDIRIKENLHDIIDNSALQIILSIEPKTYKYIDKVFMGNKRVYGFIAQQIREVIPDAVNIQISYIPNIMLLANYNNNIVTFSLQPNYVIKYNDKIKCYDKNNKEIFVVVKEIIDVLTFRIKELDNVYTDTTIFVYGSEIEDFHILDKNYIFTLNVCATQELNRLIEKQNAIIINHEKRINELKAKVSLLLNKN